MGFIGMRLMFLRGDLRVKMEDYKKETIKAYNKHAQYLSEYFKRRMDFDRRLEFRKFIEFLEGTGKKILDLGCGAGDNSVWFKENELDVEAVDLSNEMVKLAKCKGVDAEVMDIEDLKFEDNSFDGVWAVTSLLHVSKRDIGAVLNKIREIIKPNGIFFMDVKEGEGERFVVDKNDSTTKKFFVFWKQDELIDLVVNNGFELIESWKQKVGDTVFLMNFFRNKK